MRCAWQVVRCVWQVYMGGAVYTAGTVRCSRQVRHHVLLKMTTGFSAMNLLISFCRAARSSGGCGLLESTDPIGALTSSGGAPRRREGKTSTVSRAVLCVPNLASE